MISFALSMPSANTPAAAARDAFRGALPDLEAAIRACASGRELEGIGYAEDIVLTAAFGVSRTVPRLINGAYVHIDG